MKITKSILPHFIFFSFFFVVHCQVFARSNILMLDPAGDARQRGRMLCNGYERAETLKFAEAIKKRLSERWRGEIVIARTLGEEKLPLQIPSFANRLNVDLLLHVSMYHQKKASKPRATIYQLVFNAMLDFAPRSYQPLTFVPLEQAHFANIHTTKHMGRLLQEFLQQNHAKLLDVKGPIGLPLKPLIGAVGPALLLEVGLHEDDQWETLVNPVVDGLLFILQK